MHKDVFEDINLTKTNQNDTFRGLLKVEYNSQIWAVFLVSKSSDNPSRLSCGSLEGPDP